MFDRDVFRVHLAVFFDNETKVPVLKLASTIKDIFINMFPNEPQILPLPPDAPNDAPRCIFQMEGKDVSLNFSLVRMDYDAGLVDGTQWKNHIEVIANSFINICKICDIDIKRIGIVAQVRNAKEAIEYLNKKVVIDEFVKSDEKNISWVSHKKINSNLGINIFITLRFNENELQNTDVSIIDVNTDVTSELQKDNLIRVMSILTSQIGERIENVFGE